jgi:hypothetical protein
MTPVVAQQERPGGVTHRPGRLWIRRAGTSTYDVIFRPTGNGEFRIATEDGLRALLWGATIPENRIEEAIIALRTDQEHEIPDLSLSVDRLRKLGL